MNIRKTILFSAASLLLISCSSNDGANTSQIEEDVDLLYNRAAAALDAEDYTAATKYFEEASSINFRRSLKYGMGVLRVSICHFFQRLGLMNFSMYQKGESKSN